MQLIRTPGRSLVPVDGMVAALGNFDGLHLGHQAVIRKAQEQARALSLPCGVITFEPHPLSVTSQQAPERITSFQEKMCLLRTMGIDIAIVLHFTPAFAAMSAVAFIEEFLIQKLRIKHVVVGYDCIFGHKREGNFDLLLHYAQRYGFAATQVPAQTLNEKICSSSTIRKLIKEGNLSLVADLLGRPYQIFGKVLPGKKLARTLGMPTANIWLGKKALPPLGVYAVEVQIKGEKETYAGVANVGVRPTFGYQAPCLEVHLFDFSKDLYYKKMTVTLKTFIRPEITFKDIASLRKQIYQDAAQAREHLHYVR